MTTMMTINIIKLTLTGVAALAAMTWSDCVKGRTEA